MKPDNRSFVWYRRTGLDCPGIDSWSMIHANDHAGQVFNPRTLPVFSFHGSYLSNVIFEPCLEIPKVLYFVSTYYSHVDDQDTSHTCQFVHHHLLFPTYCYWSPNSCTSHPKGQLFQCRHRSVALHNLSPVYHPTHSRLHLSRHQTGPLQLRNQPASSHWLLPPHNLPPPRLNGN